MQIKRFRKLKDIRLKINQDQREDIIDKENKSKTYGKKYMNLI